MEERAGVEKGPSSGEDGPNGTDEKPRGVTTIKTTTWIGVFVVIAILVVATWYVETYLVEKEPEDFPNLEGYPRVDGSTSAHPLGVAACCYRLDTRWEWRENFMDGTLRIYPLISEPMSEDIISWVVHSGTHGSYVNLIDKRTDLILVAREPSDSELELAESKGVDLKIVPIAYDAFVFIVNVNCNVSSLTTEGIQDIYTGKTIDWLDVGSNESADINAYQRNEDSGSQELMKDLVMKDLEMISSPDMILQGMMGPINVISWDTLGIGYSVYFFEQFMAPNEMLQLVTVDGVTPSYETIQSGEYPYTTEVYAVIRADTHDNHPAKLTQDWFVSKEGQTVVKSTGYVPIKSI